MKEVPITTLLLSECGRHFSPYVKGVFIVDEPWNMLDVLRRAGRCRAREGERKIAVFRKTNGWGLGNRLVPLLRGREACHQ